MVESPFCRVAGEWRRVDAMLADGIFVHAPLAIFAGAHDYRA